MKASFRLAIHLVSYISTCNRIEAFSFSFFKHKSVTQEPWTLWSQPPTGDAHVDMRLEEEECAGMHKWETKWNPNKLIIKWDRQ